MPRLAELTAKIVKALGGAEGRAARARWSGTEPKLRIMLEGPREDRIRAWAKELSEAAKRDAHPDPFRREQLYSPPVMLKHLAAAAAASSPARSGRATSWPTPPRRRRRRPRGGAEHRWGNRMLAGHTCSCTRCSMPGPSARRPTSASITACTRRTCRRCRSPGSRTTDLLLIGVTSTADLGIKLTDWSRHRAQGRALALLSASTASRSLRGRPRSAPAASSRPSCGSHASRAPARR